MSMVEYIVTLKNFEDLESFYEDMETPGGTVYIPDRAVVLANRRPISRNTHYYLTESEAEQLRGDPRVLAVEQLPSARGIFPKPTWTQTANYEKSSTIDSNDKNWALYRCTEGAQTAGWATNGNATVLNRTVNTTSSGRNVDVIIVDSHLKFDHPEFAVNPDGTGGSRAIQFNWWQYSANVGLATTGSYSYTNVASSHGTHVAGITAGNTQGWARDANIYNIEFNYNYISGLPANTDFVLWIWDYIREFHKNKPINPVTGRKNPTVVNNSWGYVQNDVDLNYIAAVFYRGATVTLSGDYAARKAQLEANGVPVPYNTYVNDTPMRVSAVDEDVGDTINEGIIIVASAGNSYWRCIDIDSEDYNNYAQLNVGNSSPYYHSQGSTPGASNTAICVGSIGEYLGEYKSYFSNYGSRVDIYAPGSHIISSVYNSTGFSGYPTPVADPRNSSYYIQSLDGTSMSGPQVTGCLACLAETWPSLTQAEARQYLETYGKYNQITSTGGGAGDYYSLGDSLVNSNNLYLFYRLERKLSGDLSQNAYKLRPSAGVAYPRPKIKRYG